MPCALFATSSSFEPNATAILLTIAGLLLAISVLFSRTVDRLGLPLVLLFLVLGMLGGSEGIGRVHFENYSLSMRLGTVALVLILFDGGMNTSTRAIRNVLLPASLLATIGVALTAGFVAGFSHLLGLPWSQAMLLGAVVSSTDAAAVFAVLRGGRIALQPRVGNTIEVESCVNDPMAVILTTTILEVLTGKSASPWMIAISVPLQLAVGAAAGAIIGYLGRALLQQVRVPTVGLYPALTLALACVSFGAATLAHGSGFLAVYATAVFLGNSKIPYRSGLIRIHDALAWLSQIAMFLMLGLLVFPSRLVPVIGLGVGVGLFLTFVARPLAVFACLAPLRMPLKETGYISWVGLRGAVPIILAIFPVLAGVDGADRIFNAVFFIVVLSAIVPGATIRAVTRVLKLGSPEKPQPAAVLEVNSVHPLTGELTSFFIDPSVAVCGAKIREIEFPQGAAIVLIVRGNELIAAKGDTKLEAGDHVYVFFHDSDRGFIELLFGRPM